MSETLTTTVTELPESRVRVDVRVPAGELQQRVEHKARQLGKDLKLPGFRRGKVPAPLVIQRVGRPAVLEEAGFDPNDPANISPLVVWLGSADSRDVTGRVFEVEGGMISVADGWQHGPSVDRGERWNPAAVGAAVRDLLAKAPAPAPVYGAQ